jgi:hypothetical protein
MTRGRHFVRTPRPSHGYPAYGYEIYLPNVIAAYLKEAERTTEHESTLGTSTRACEFSPFFHEAAWHLCRRGILRPGVNVVGARSSGEGDGYCVTALGRSWIEQRQRTGHSPLGKKRDLIRIKTLRGYACHVTATRFELRRPRIRVIAADPKLASRGGD